MRFTDHSKKRIKERAGHKSFEKMAVRALELGMGLENSKGKIKQYIKEKSMDGKTYKIYGEFLYVFAENKGDEPVFITMFEIPQELKKLVAAQAKRLK